jgi:hypothetical protein
VRASGSYLKTNNPKLQFWHEPEARASWGNYNIIPTDYFKKEAKKLIKIHS